MRTRYLAGHSKLLEIYSRMERYKSVHPITYRGVAKMCGANHRYLSYFMCKSRKSIPVDDIERLDKFLIERGF